MLLINVKLGVGGVMMQRSLFFLNVLSFIACAG